MSINLLYGSDNYAPNTPFFFDKVYPNFKEASLNAPQDGVMIGRYILIAYSNEAYSKDERVALERIANTNGSVSALSSDEQTYIANYKIDQAYSEETGLDYRGSRDRRVYKKSYESNVYKYTPIAYLHSDLSNDEIAILGVQSNDNLLAIDETRTLSSTLGLKYNNRQLQLKGRKGTIDDIDSSSFVKDNIATDNYLKWNTTNKQAYIDLMSLVENSDKILSMTSTEKLKSTLNLEYIRNYKDAKNYIVLKGINGQVISEIDATDFIKDSFLEKVEYDTNTSSLIFTFKTENGVQQVSNVSFDIMNPGNGIQITGNTISIKRDNSSDSEAFLSVSGQGIKLSGVQSAIDSARDAAIAASENKVYQKNTLTELNQITGKKNIGDIGIVTTNMANNKKSYTAYVWNGTAWAAMDGNYNAENVYFNEDIILAGAYTTVGNITKSSNAATSTLSTTGKSLKQVMEQIFTKELYPAQNSQRDIPNITLQGDSDTTGEVGTNYTLPTVNVKVNDVGSYAYGPPTDIKFTAGNMTIAQGNISSASNKRTNTSDMVKNSTLSLTATDTETIYTDTAKSYVFNASGNYTAGAVPQTNLGTLLDNNTNSSSWTYRIPSGTVTATPRTIKRIGYRNMFCGGTSASTINSTIIRGFTAKQGEQPTSESNALEFTAPSGTTKVICAYPQTWNGTPYFEMFGLAWAENVNFVKKADSVQVADARGGSNGLIPYTLYVWELETELKAESTNFRVWFKNVGGQ